MAVTEIKTFTTSNEERPIIGKFKVGSELFNVRAPADSARLMALNMVSLFEEAGTDDKTAASAMGALIDFMGACMNQQDHNRLYRMLVNPSTGMSTEEVIELARWVLEKASTFPTELPTASPRGQRSTGTKSTAASPRRVPARSKNSR